MFKWKLTLLHELVWTRPLGNTHIHDLGYLSLVEPALAITWVLIGTSKSTATYLPTIQKSSQNIPVSKVVMPWWCQLSKLRVVNIHDMPSLASLHAGRFESSQLHSCERHAKYPQSGVEVKPAKFRCIPQKWTLWHHGKIIENANVIEWHNFLTYLTCTINETKWWQLMTPDDTWPPNVWQISTELASFNGAILPFQGLAMHRWDPLGGRLVDHFQPQWRSPWDDGVALHGTRMIWW